MLEISNFIGSCVQRFSPCVVLTAAGLAIALNFGQLSAQNNEKKCLVECIPFPGKDDSNWTALYAASDGKVYTGLSTHKWSAHFYRYDPSTNKNQNLLDMAEFLEERGKGIRTSGKLHTSIVEDVEGNLYFATIGAAAGPQNIDIRSWKGGYWLKYDPKRNEFQNLGLIASGLGMYSLAIDKDRNYLYGGGFTGYLYRFDLKTHKTRNLDRTDNWQVSREIVIDDLGNARVE